MSERRVATYNREGLQNLLLAFAALVASVGLCVAINWFFYSDYSWQRADRESKEIKRRVMCTELREKRDAQPRNLHVALEYKKCTINRSSVGKRA